jgi:hypothetical protein
MYYFIYRYYPGENIKDRPHFYSKRLALKSFLNAYRKVHAEKKLIFFVDAHPGTINLLDGYEELITETYFLNGIGNSNSYLKSIEYIVKLNDNDIFYLSEDDYLYLPKALGSFVDAIEKLAFVQYVTLYDHPDRYTRSDNKCPPGGEHIYITDINHWRTVESTCCTFGGRVFAIKEDRNIHEKFTRNQKYPGDRNIWYKTIGIKKYFRKYPRRVLIAPIPSLATHMASEYLSPIIDWEAIATATLGTVSVQD